MQNKNKKIQQINSSKKRRKTFLILGASLLTASAVAIPTALILTKSSSTNYINVKFDGNGHELVGTTIFKIKADSTFENITVPEVKLSLSESLCGWAKSSDFENGKVDATKIIKTSTKLESSTYVPVLKSSVKNADAIQWATITFNQDAAKISTLSGNVRFEIPAGVGIKFADINKPSVSCKGGQKFISWADASGNDISPTQLITADLDVYSKTAGAEILTFDLNGGKKDSGSLEQPIEVGTTFSKINKPIVSHDDQAGKKMYFAGWYSTLAAATSLDQTKLVNDTYTFSTSTTIYAGWTTNDTGEYCVITAVQPVGKTIEYDSNTEFVVKSGLLWKEFNKPNPKTDQYKVTGWEYSTTSATSGFIAVTDDTAFTASAAWIRPILQIKINDMYIIEQDAQKATTYEFETNVSLPIICYTNPAEVSQAVTWKLFKLDGSEITDENVAKLTPTTSTAAADLGKATLIVKDSSLEAIEVQATSKADTEWKVNQVFTKSNPYVLDTKFFTEINGINYELKYLDDPNNKIAVINKDGTTKESIDRESFKYPVYISDKVTEIPSDFMSGCTGFDGTIKRSDTAKPITKIGNNVFMNCSSFNSDISALVKDVQVIGNNFLCNATGFNGSDLEMESVQYIGDNFLYNTGIIDQTISFPKVKKIGNSFLENCANFNQNITFPETLTDLGDHCMCGCDSYVSTITMNTNPVQTGILSSSVDMFSTTNSSAQFADPGFNFAGTYADAAHSCWYDMTDKQGHYRKSTVEEKKVKTFTLTGTYTTEFMVGDTYKSDFSLDVEYEDSTHETVTSGWTTDYDGKVFATTDVGLNTVTVSYKDVDVTYEINVSASAYTTLPDYFKMDGNTLYINQDHQDEVPEICNIKRAYLDNTGELVWVNKVAKFDASGSPVAQITIADGIQEIQSDCFSTGCPNVTSITIGKTVGDIGANALNTGALQKLTFNNTAEWSKQMSMESIEISSDPEVNAQNYLSESAWNKVALSRTKRTDIPTGLNVVSDSETGGYGVSWSYGTISAHFTVNELYTDDGNFHQITAVNGFSKAGTTLTSITLPDSVKSIKTGSFTSNAITEIEIPFSCKTIEMNSFNTMTKVKFRNMSKTWTAEKEGSTPETLDLTTATEEQILTFFNSHLGWTLTTK